MAAYTALPHTIQPSLLVMANRGPNTNSSQFFISLGPSPHLLGKHVVFGRVVKGYEIAEQIADLPTDARDRPLEKILIAHCGELELRQAPPPPPPRKRSASVSVSASESESDRESRKKRQKKDKSKKKHKKRRRSEDREREEEEGEGERSSKPTEPRQETEEEYDARLEREENERLREARLKALEAARKEAEIAKQNSGTGIRYKGEFCPSLVPSFHGSVLT